MVRRNAGADLAAPAAGFRAGPLRHRLDLPRAKLAGELSRLIDTGLVEIGGPAASRGGRRSTLVHLADDLRFIAVDVGATSLAVAITDGRCEVLANQREDCDVR